MRVLKSGLVLLFYFLGSLHIAFAESGKSHTDEADSSEKIDVTEKGGLDRLGEAARKGGWRVERDEQGNLLLFPDSLNRTSTQEPGQEQKIELGDLDALEKALADKSWRTSRDASGNLLLYPPAMTGNETGSELGTAPATSTGKSGDGDLDLLEKMLQSTGWTTARDDAGNLLLYPRTSAEKPLAAGFSLQVGSCHFDEIKMGLGAEIVLPIDQWSEVREIAEAWLDYSGDGSEQIGKIRKVNRLYLVSIVEANAPFNLLKQLVINSLDGRVIVI